MLKLRYNTHERVGKYLVTQIDLVAYLTVLEKYGSSLELELQIKTTLNPVKIPGIEKNISLNQIFILRQ